MPEPTDVVFFAAPAELRAWLDANHDTADELWVGLWKKATGEPSLTWNELVDEVLCRGWIDGIRKTLDEQSYTIRITPRRPNSIWSAKNLARMEELIEEGRMQPSGRAVWDARDPAKTYRYSFERERVELSPEYEAELRADAAAWAYWTGESPSYRKTVTWWVMSAKREETRRRRLATLVADCAAGRRIAAMRSSGAP